jgi:hypothetical protein
MQNKREKSRLKGWLQLTASLFAVWALTFVVLPAITDSSVSFQTIARFIDYSGIDTGQFYYTDVEIVTRADIGARSTIEYFSGKKL